MNLRTNNITDDTTLATDDPASVVMAQVQSASGPVIYDDWKVALDAGFNTKTKLKYLDGLVPKPGQRCCALYVEKRTMTVEQFRTFRDANWERLRQAGQSTDDFFRMANPTRVGNQYEVTVRSIPLFHHDQMIPGNFQPRTRAIIEYGRVLWLPSDNRNYIVRSVDDATWITRFCGQDEVNYFPFFTESLLKDHLNHRAIYGVKPHPQRGQRWMAIDLDLHVAKGGRPDIFLRQVEAVLRMVHGKGWIICLRDPAGPHYIDGIHLLHILDKPAPVNEIRSDVRDLLQTASTTCPDLENEALNAGMKPIAQAEVFPDPKRGFRLPLGRGYTAITDHVLHVIQYHKYHGKPLLGADVESLMGWTGNEMAIDDKLAHIAAALPKAQPIDILTETKPAKPKVKLDPAITRVEKELTGKKLLGQMKGRYRQVLVDFFTGKMQIPKSLQTGILLGANALWAENYPLDQRSPYLLDLLQGIKITNPSFSSRIVNGQWDAIFDDIEHMVHSTDQLRANPSKALVQSNELLKAWAKAMKDRGFSFHDRATWTNNATSLNNRYRIELTKDDVELITTAIAPVFCCEPAVAVEAVIKMVQLTAIKARHGHGMSREYRRALLSDLGISCRENAKLAACWKVVEDAGFIAVRQRHVFNQAGGKGKARVYAVGPRVRDKVYPPQDRSDWPDWAKDMAEEQDRIQYDP